MIYCPNAWHRFALFCQDNFPRKATTTYVSVYAVSTFSLSLAGFQGGHTGNPSSSHRVGVCMCVCVYLYVNWSRLFIAIILHKFIEAQPNLICLYHIAYNQVFAVTCPQTTSNTLPSLFGSGLGSWNIFCHGSWEQRENIVHRNFFSGTVSSCAPLPQLSKLFRCQLPFAHVARYHRDARRESRRIFHRVLLLLPRSNSFLADTPTYTHTHTYTRSHYY